MDTKPEKFPVGSVRVAEALASLDVASRGGFGRIISRLVPHQAELGEIFANFHNKFVTVFFRFGVWLARVSDPIKKIAEHVQTCHLGCACIIVVVDVSHRASGCLNHRRH